MEKVTESEFSKNIIRILKGSIISIVITVVLLIIFATVLTYTNIQENTINPIIIVVSGISILIGSSISTIKIHKNGIINGGLVGGIYIFVLYLISSVINSNFSLNTYSVIMILISIIMGVVGGIIGVNLNNR